MPTQVTSLLQWTNLTLTTNSINSCTEKELKAVLQIRDIEEAALLSTHENVDLLYVM